MRGQPAESMPGVLDVEDLEEWSQSGTPPPWGMQVRWLQEAGIHHLGIWHLAILGVRLIIVVDLLGVHLSLDMINYANRFNRICLCGTIWAYRQPHYYTPDRAPYPARVA